MGLFTALVDVVAMPVRIAVDVVKAPVKALNGDGDFLENTSKGIRKIERELDE